MDKLYKLLETIREQFEQEGWYCVLADKSSFNQNPDLKTDFEVGFDYRDLRALSIIDFENRIVMNSYFYIVDDKTFYLLGDPTHSDKPIEYQIDNIDTQKLIDDIKRVINYY
ncbi:MAG: hypothetical protein GWO07_09710 [Candidatus Dadabacteria bacterium]|nr:hypothetical protein [Candidatus Dadabacteria bacterium]